MGTWWNEPPDFANAVYEEPDALLAEQVADAIRQFFRGRDDVDSFRELIEEVTASVTAQRGRAPDGRPMLRLRIAEPGRGGDYTLGAPRHDPTDHAAELGIDIARELLDALLPDRRLTVTFRPEIGADHPLWTEGGYHWDADDPELGLSEELQRDLTAWATTEDWANRKPKLNAEGEALLARVRAELPERYDLVDDWRRD